MTAEPKKPPQIRVTMPRSPMLIVIRGFRACWGKHLFRGLQQQHVAAAAGHDGDFQKICAQFLHAAQAADQFVFERCFFKIVIGEHYADAGAVGGSHQVRNTVSAGKSSTSIRSA